jgi:hypothetical protein
MTAQPGYVPQPHELVADLPGPGLKPGPSAQVPARAREEATPSAAAAVAWAPRLLTGASLLTEQPASLAALWGHHVKAAQFFEFSPFKTARYCWGAIHIVIATVTRTLEWGTRSFPVGLALVGLVIAAVFLI